MAARVLFEHICTGRSSPAAGEMLTFGADLDLASQRVVMRPPSSQS
jgi:hypothetical protein